MLSLQADFMIDDCKKADSAPKGDAALRNEAVNYLAYDRLKDGQKVMIRPVCREDKNTLQEAMHHLSKESRYFRFFTPKDELTEKELQYFTELDYVHHVGLVAYLLENGKNRPVGVGRYIVGKDPASAGSAELAFAVDEQYQGRGVATVLLKHLTTIARNSGLRQFTALVLRANEKMLRVFEHCGLPMKNEPDSDGVYNITLAIEQKEK